MKFLKFIIPFGIIALIAAWYYVDQPVADIEDLKTEIRIDATEFFTEYNADEAAGNAKYLDKIIEVKGTIINIDNAENGSVNITLESGDEMFGVSCKLSPSKAGEAASLKTGDDVVIKGKCTGLLMDVVLVDCMILNQ